MSRTARIAVEFQVDQSVYHAFDVWAKRPGIASCASSWLPGTSNYYIHASGSRTALRRLVRELFDQDYWPEYYEQIDFRHAWKD